MAYVLVGRLMQQSTKEVVMDLSCSLSSYYDSDHFDIILTKLIF